MGERPRKGRPSPNKQRVASTVRHEEELEVGKRPRQDVARVRKVIERGPDEKVVPRDIEHADVLEHAAPNPNDSGEIETLPDGSVSIPVFEEELVVSKRMVLRERVIVRKRTVTEQVRVRERLRKERVKIEQDEDTEQPGSEQRKT
ncbi:MAG TPA: DUF2382 domain-containing protein [Actinomycetota bacterium]